MKERKLSNIEPANVLGYFEDLTEIPRESGNEKEVSDYLMAFAKANELECHQDEYNNVLIKKKASPGYEDHKGVILQAHMDMVCEKNPDFDCDFSKDPISFDVEGDIIIAKNTSLGADDGIGVALALAILADKDLKHPPLEFLCTTDEERGMSGIENFNFDLLTGDRVINLDSDDEGVIVVGCAGGPVVRIELPITRVDLGESGAYDFLKIKIRGLKGGHSGEDIHRGGANANKLLNRVLIEINEECGMDLVDITGGLQYNAIPRAAEAVIRVAGDKKKDAESIVEKYQRIFASEYRVNDSGIELSCEDDNSAYTTALSAASKSAVLDYILLSETGIVRMDADFPAFVESSLSLGVVNIEGDKAVIWTMTRSSVESQYNLMFKKIVRLTELFNGSYTVMSNCPHWQYRSDSEMKALYEEIYEEMFGKKTSFMILHAGVEPSEFAKNIDRELDMISLGPDVRHLHAPGEYFSISSTGRVWSSLLKLLERL